MRTEYRYGAKIKEFRSKRGWTQEHLAEVASLSPRTVQRLEREATAGLDALMAVAQALETNVDQLRTKYWITEQKPLRALRIEQPGDFVEALRRAPHEFLYAKLCSVKQEDIERVDDYLAQIFSDYELMSPDDGHELLSSWSESIQHPLHELRAMSLVLFSIQECRDRFLKGDGPGKRIPMEDWTRCYFLVVPQNGCFRLGGRDSKDEVHEFNPKCKAAVEIVHRVYQKELELGVFASAMAPIVAAGGEHFIKWCDCCFPVEEDGQTRIGFGYLERLTGMNKSEIERAVAAWSNSNLGHA